jgi:flagellin-like hook-associated protein FlgL
MSTDITLSKGVRSNLLSLQSTAELLGRTQERLSTGKKVNSALDNPINFFTSSGLSSRANDLSRLLDSVGNGVQTINAADKGISAIKKLIESAQATARQALTAGEATTTYSFSTTGSVAIAADTAATGTGSVAFLADAAAQKDGSVTGVTNSADLNTSLSLGGATQTLSITVNGSVTNLTIGTGNINTGADLLTAIDGITGIGATSFGTNQLRVAADDATFSLSFGGAAATTLGLNGAMTVSQRNLLTQDATLSGTALTIQYGSGATNTINFGTGVGQVQTRAQLLTAIGATGSFTGGNFLNLTAAANTDAINVGGAARAKFGLNATYSPTNTQVAGFNGQVTFQLGSGSVQSIEFGNGATGEITTRQGLESRLTAIGAALGTGVTLSVNGSGNINVASTSSSSMTIGGTAAAAAGLVANTYAPTQTYTANTTRSSLQNDFNNLLSQITTLAKDASFNGVNLLDNDNLSVIFNEDGSSSLSITGVDFSASGLGMTNVTGNAFQSNTGVNASLAQLDAATSTLRTQSSRFGSNLSIVQTRQDFTKNLISVLQTGADNLVLADTNEEGANMLALQTRQQLSSVALSMASQADQNVLRLF